MPSNHLVIRKCLVLDGTGSAPFEGDVAIVGSRIAPVSAPLSGTVRERSDICGLAVTPAM